MSRASASSRLIRQILTGQRVTANNSQAKLINQVLTGGLSGNQISSPLTSSATAIAPGMRRTNSVIDPSTGKILGLGPAADAPPVLSATSRHPVGSGVTLKDVNKAAIAAIAAQYDPAIGAIGGEIAHTRRSGHKEIKQIKRRGNRAVGDLSILYGGLARYSKRSQRRENRGYHRDVKQTKQLYNNLSKETAGVFDTSTGSTAAELKRLGIDPATALAGAAQDRAFVTASNAQDRTRRIQNERASRRGMNSIMNRIHGDIITSGLAAIGQSKSQTEAGIQDAAKQIADQIFQLRMQRNQLSSQRVGALASQHANLLQQRLNLRASRRANLLNNQYKQAQIAKLLGLTPGSSTNAANPTDSIGKGLAFLEQNAGKLPHAVALENILQYVTGGSGPGQATPWDKHYYPQIWKHLVTTGQRHKWTQQEMNYLQRAVQIALGI